MFDNKYDNGLFPPNQKDFDEDEFDNDGCKWPYDENHSLIGDEFDYEDDEYWDDEQYYH